MDCCQCQGIESTFNRRQVASELKTYRRSGPKRTTRMLIDAIVAGGVQGETLLDIGGGVGAIQHALLEDGASSAIHVDASTAYIAASRAESQRRGYADRVTYYHGNFVDLAADIPPADIVTLDRVICCYHDMPTLVGRSAAKARRVYGLVYPRDVWWVRAGVKVVNVLLRLQRSGFRIFAHPSEAVDAVVRGNGLEQRFMRKTGMWQVVVYARS